MAAEHAAPADGTARRGGVPFPPPLIYASGFAVGIVLEVLFPTGSLPFQFAVIGAVAGVTLWLVLDPFAMVRFSRAETSVTAALPASVLVTDGPYRMTRNPMYLGMAFLYAGLAVAFSLWWSLVLLAVVLLVVDRGVIPPEERHLEQRFGDEYLRYRARVRRWI